MYLLAARILCIHVVLLLSFTSAARLPECQEQSHIIFIEQPVDVTVGCRSEERAVFSCKYEGSIANPYWMINSTVYSSIDSQLPQDHMYDHNELTVVNVPKNNGTEYQCYLLFLEGSSPCARRSSVGRLLVECRDFYVDNLPYYSYEHRDLKEINTTITQMDTSDSVYSIRYVDSDSGDMCGAADIDASSCVDGVCSHMFNTSSSRCSTNKSINVIASAVKLNVNSSEIATIDVINNFVNVSLSRMNSTLKIKCKFSNQPQRGENLCKVTVRPNCGNLTRSSQGSVSDASYVMVQFDNILMQNETCFVVSAMNVTKTIFVKGIYIHNSASSVNTGPRFSSLLLQSTLVICSVILYYIFP